MDLFCEVPCLVERSNTLSGIDLCKKWFTKADRKNPAEVLRKFIEYNLQQFEFLETVPSIEGTDRHSGIVFRTSRYIGAIPLRAPDTGKQIGDFVVAPRFVNRERFEDYIEILDLLGRAISPEVVASSPLASGRNFRPPFYLEAVKFVVALERMLQKPWRKFDCTEVVRREPSGQVDWEKYIQVESMAENKLRFPVRQNILSEFHREFRQIRFVFNICKMELRSSNVPPRIRKTFRSRLASIEQRLYLHTPLASDSLLIKSSDRPAVRDCKEQANRILKRHRTSSTAWRVDFNDVFGKFTLHIFEKIAHAIGGKLSVETRDQKEMGSHGPDAILHTQDLTAFIEAKYKSHLFNKLDRTESLKNDFQRDVRRAESYARDTPAENAVAVVCFPSDEVEVDTAAAGEISGNTSKNVLIVGIPLKRSVITEAVSTIAVELDRLRSNS